LKVLMFGWEFPPHSQGGLGTACYGLTRGLSGKGVDVCFVLPRGRRGAESSHVDLVVTENLYIDNKRIRMKAVDSMLASYMTPFDYEKILGEKTSSNITSSDSKPGSSIYGKDLFSEVERFAGKAGIIAGFEDHDVIHAHDWMTYKAGIAAKQVSGKPLVVHVHATEFDRTGGSCNQHVYDIERMGMHAADKIIAVSNFTKNMIIKHYGVSPDKVQVVHNGIYCDGMERCQQRISTKDKIVLFLGRVTLQKGPDYFLYAAHKVAKQMPDVKFVIAGTGDMLPRMIEKAAEMGLGSKVMFTGHLTGADIDRAYQMADLYVMPSVSEPFGITPLESVKNGTPVIISKQSGVSEVHTNSLKVDFWDIDEMANKMVSCLAYGALSQTITHHAKNEIANLSWDSSAAKCLSVYKSVSG